MFRLRRIVGVTVISLVGLLNSGSVFAQEKGTRPVQPIDSLSEVRDKHRALLLVFKSGVLDASDNERAIIDQVLRADPEPQGRNRWVYGQIAKKLNAYIRKYKSLS